MRFDSTSQKELLLNWIREESKALLELFFTETDTDSESGLEQQRMNGAKDGLNSDEKSIRVEALKVLTDVIMNHDISPFELLHTGILSTLLRYLLKPGRPLEFIQTIAKLPPLNQSASPNASTAAAAEGMLIIPSDNEAFIRLVHKINQIISQVIYTFWTFILTKQLGWALPGKTERWLEQLKHAAASVESATDQVQFAARPELHQDEELDQWARQGDVLQSNRLKVDLFY